MRPSNFAFAPVDGRPNRIMRYVGPGVLPYPFLAIYDEKLNILTIDRQHFDLLSPTEQRRLLRTHQPYTEISSALPDAA